MMFSNVIVDITFTRFPFVFSQSCCEVSNSFSNAGDLAFGAIARCLFLGSSLSLTLVSKSRSIVMGLWVTRILKGCRMREMLSDMLFMYGMVAVVEVLAASFVSLEAVARGVFRRRNSSL